MGVYVSLSKASQITGKSKSVIYNSLKNGVLSYVSKDTNGYKIDMAELCRVFNIKENQEQTEPVLKNNLERNETPNAPPKNAHEIEILKLKLIHAEKLVEIYKDQANIYKEQAENWKKQANQLLLQSPQSPKNDIKKLVRDELINIIRKKTTTKKQSQTIILWPIVMTDIDVIVFLYYLDRGDS